MQTARQAIRIVKKPDQRRSELLDCAQELFLARGYDHTTINDVIARAGVSKGALYHYFTSKEAMLEALAERFAARSIEQLGDIFADRSPDALSRLNAFLARSRQLRREAAPMIRPLFAAIFRPENIVLYHRISAAGMALMTPLLARIIAQGVKEKIFRTPDPVGTAEMILQLGAAAYGVIARALNATSEHEVADAADTLEDLLKLHGIAIDRILCLPEGSVRLVDRGFVRAMMLAGQDGKPARGRAGKTTKARRHKGRRRSNKL
ncbi:MAG TPA: TetR/AcrR family transcriptional regulator [Candidatus Binataceae bacterium]|nr:TetR/AcrR family transcriptional regulator [Candidatus Binataceae bacterium]